MRESTAMSQIANMMIPPSSELSTRTSALNIADLWNQRIMALLHPLTFACGSGRHNRARECPSPGLISRSVSIDEIMSIQLGRLRRVSVNLRKAIVGLSALLCKFLSGEPLGIRQGRDFPWHA
jgi:hypothetical protein